MSLEFSLEINVRAAGKVADWETATITCADNALLCDVMDDMKEAFEPAERLARVLNGTLEVRLMLGDMPIYDVRGVRHEEAHTAWVRCAALALGRLELAA